MVRAGNRDHRSARPDEKQVPLYEFRHRRGPSLFQSLLHRRFVKEIRGCWRLHLPYRSAAIPITDPLPFSLPERAANFKRWPIGEDTHCRLRCMVVRSPRRLLLAQSRLAWQRAGFSPWLVAISATSRAVPLRYEKLTQRPGVTNFIQRISLKAAKNHANNTWH